MKCVVCKAEVDWDSVTQEFYHIFDQADLLGVESLTENKQVVYEGKICSEECYTQLN